MREGERETNTQRCQQTQQTHFIMVKFQITQLGNPYSLFLPLKLTAMKKVKKKKKKSNPIREKNIKQKQRFSTHNENVGITPNTERISPYPFHPFIHPPPYPISFHFPFKPTQPTIMK